MREAGTASRGGLLSLTRRKRDLAAGKSSRAGSRTARNSPEPAPVVSASPPPAVAAVSASEDDDLTERLARLEEAQRRMTEEVAELRATLRHSFEIELSLV